MEEVSVDCSVFLSSFVVCDSRIVRASIVVVVGGGAIVLVTIWFVPSTGSCFGAVESEVP